MSMRSMKQLLNMIGSVIVNNLSLMMIISSTSKEKTYLKLLEKYKVKFKAITYGKGTASSSLLKYFGLDEVERCLILSVMPIVTSKHLLKYMETRLKITDPGNGIALTIPLSSSTKYMSEVYAKTKLEDIEMKESNKHLIVTIANEGYAELVMNAAKKVGAAGGTTINGRGLETEKIIKFLGISIEPEKDIVLILVDDNKKTDIMNAIVESCGLKTPGAGICFSLPVDYVAGLKEELIN